MTKFLLLFLFCAFIVPLTVDSGLLTAMASYGICQKGCSLVVVACYAAAGATFGTITAGAGTPAVIIGCNTAFAGCQAACAAAAIAGGFTPTP